MSMTGGEAVLVLPVSPGRDHIRGPVDAPVSVVEYGDFECPSCAAARPIVNAVQMKLGGLMHLVFRHFPMSTAHPHARQAAEAAESVGARGRFWPMHDLLLENQDHLETPYLLAYAKAAGVDPNVVAAELAQGIHAPKVQEDFMSGVRSGVNGTPTFYINGVRYDGSWRHAPLLAAISSAARQRTRV